MEEKRLKNREAAAKSRQRKKEKTESLQNEVVSLRAQSKAVEKDLSRLRALSRKLRAIQSEHEKICPHQRFLDCWNLKTVPYRHPSKNGPGLIGTARSELQMHNKAISSFLLDFDWLRLWLGGAKTQFLSLTKRSNLSKP